MAAKPDSPPAPLPRTIAELIRHQARLNPQAPAMLAPGGHPTLTYERLSAHIEQTVASLNGFGIGRNDRVAIVLPNGPELATAFLAVASGAASAPLNPAYRADEFDFYLSDLHAKALVVRKGADTPAAAVAESRGIPILELEPENDAPAGIFSLHARHPKQQAPAQRGMADPGLAQSGDVALVLHTSGTTSRPKIVPLTQANICASAAHIQAALNLGPEDRCLNVMPLFHIHGLIGVMLASMSAGASVVATPGFDAIKFFSWLDEFQPNWYSAVPTMHQMIVARAPRNQDVVDRARLRLIRSSSAALPPQVMADLERVFGAPVIESYGMTEAAHQMASNPLPPRARKPGSVGVAAGPEIAVLDDQARPLAPGQTGEIAIRGANVTPGYENNPDANLQAFTKGWFRTGDQGYLDPEGYLFITGRLKEIINRGGEKISPREVDEVLLDHPAVQQVVTFALPHPKLGEEVAAAVVPRDGQKPTEKELREFALQRLADFKVPSRIIFLEEIPKGPTGKLQRIGLAQKLGLA
jgi:oxalate---CoA ligase